MNNMSEEHSAYSTTALKDPRLNRVLKDNELRRYLANKAETARDCLPPRPAEIRGYGKPFDHAPRVLLIGPPLSIPRYMQKRCIPPLGLCYIAAMLELHGCDVKMIDCCVEGYDTEQIAHGLMTYGLPPSCLARKIGDFEPDLIGISVLFSNDLPNVMETARAVKSLFAAVPVILGGLHPSIYPEDVLELAKSAGHGVPCIDWILRGEGEYRLLDFVGRFRRGELDVHADGLVGIVDGHLICNAQHATIPDLDALPFPAYHLLPMERYFEISIPFSPVPKGDRVIQILTSRGCPIGCSFCASTNLYKRYRVRSIENVTREIKHWQSQFQIDEIQFADDNLTLLADRTRNLIAALKPVALPWCTPNGTMVNTLNTSLLAEMRNAGLYQITLSIDSGSVKTLRECHHKPVDLSRVPELIQACEALGVWTHGTLVIGMPGESLSEIRLGLAYVLENLPFTSISTFIAQPIPGSELYHAALESGLISRGEALHIDSTRCRLHLSDIDSETLEGLAVNFQRQFTEQARARDPEAYRTKYAKLIQRGLLNPESATRLA